MPIDKDLIIQPPKEKKKYSFGIKDACLIITTCISIFSPIVAFNEVKVQKLQYELEKANYENDIQKLELEKANYENMLKENDIQLKSSYIVCPIDDVINLYYNFGNEKNVKILSNDITKMFYDDKQKVFLNTNDMKNIDINLQDKYENDVYSYVYFLKIEVISNRLVSNIKIKFRKIETENNIEERFEKFGYLVNKEYYKIGEDIELSAGDVQSNDIILVPVVLIYGDDTKDPIDYQLSDLKRGYIIYNYNESIYRKIYVPKTIVCYDVLYEKEKSFDVRDVLEDFLITRFYFNELG